MNKKIGVLSDLHLEGSNMDNIENPGWDILILAGDISTDLNLLDKFFNYKLPKDIPIIYVLGNHEYEGRRIKDVVGIYKELLKEYKNVTILDNESVVIEGIKFIGSTLWSNFELDGIENKKEGMKWAKQNIIDFTYIFKEDKKLGRYRSIDPEDMELEFNKSYEFLEYELKKNEFDGEKVVITHFAPHKNSINEKYKKMNNSYWVNNLENLLGFSKYWIHGHTHTSLNYNVEGTNVLCNPRGYSKIFNIDSNEEFNRELIIELESKILKKYKKN